MIDKFAIDHDYYCSMSNYYSNDAAGHYTTWADFYEEFYDADIDMNLIFRWDIKQRKESKRYYANIFMIHQRKGIFMPIMIDYIDEKDMDSFVELTSKHWQKLVSIWHPISVQ